jgi:hypothetical protein
VVYSTEAMMSQPQIAVAGSSLQAKAGARVVNG